MTPDARAGDYSLVFLRQVVQSKVVTRIITGEYYPKAKKFNAPAEHRVIGVLDLNGDGILEIVLSGRYYEGEGSTPAASMAPKSSSYSAWDAEPEDTGA